MKGMFFIEILDGQLVSSGQIEEDAGAGHWLCVFNDTPPRRNVIPVAAMRAMQLFQTAEDMAEWVENHQEPPARGTLPDKEPAAKKPAPKKRAAPKGAK